MGGLVLRSGLNGGGDGSGGWHWWRLHRVSCMLLWRRGVLAVACVNAAALRACCMV